MKKIMFLAILILLLGFTGCLSENENSEQTKLTSAIEDMISLGENARRVEGEVSSGIYFKTDEGIFFYSIEKLGEVVSDQGQLMEMLSRLNSSDKNESYLVYNGQAVSYADYENAGDFNDPVKAVPALDVLPVDTVVHNVETGTETYVDGTDVVDVFSTVEFSNFREIYGMGYEFDVIINVNDGYNIDKVSIAGTSSDITIENNTGQLTLLMSFDQYDLGEAEVSAYAGDNFIESEVFPFTQANVDTEVPTIPSNVTAVPESTSRILIDWEASTDNEGVQGYAIYRDGVKIYTTIVTQYSDGNLTSDTEYSYEVLAYDAAGNESDRSDLVTVRTNKEIVQTEAIIANHETIDITEIPQEAIVNAKANLHIAYGHTSHGSQITSGMSGLVSFMNNKGYPNDLYAWNHSGSNGALHLYEGDGYGNGDMDHDAGYYPLWVNETRNYLGTTDANGMGSNHPEMNVIMWSWCGQASGKSEASMISEYLAPMTQLEEDYPGVTFVYMTGHADGSGESGNLHQRNRQILEYCQQNDKVLFDFYDIECYDPDGKYFGDKDVRDDCRYDGGNWATEWQNSHTEGVDWYNCSSAHSQPLNANMKAYAAWWMFARIAGWDGGNEPDTEAPTIPQNLIGNAVSSAQIDINWATSTDNRRVTGYKVYRDDVVIATVTGTSYSDTGLTPAEYYIYEVTAIDAAGNESEKAGEIQIQTQEEEVDEEAPSEPADLAADNVTSSSAKLSWTASTDNVCVNGYNIYRDGVKIGNTVETYYVDNGLEQETEYSYQISAYDCSDNESSLCEAISITTTNELTTKTIRLENSNCENPCGIEDAFLKSGNPDTNYGMTKYISPFERYIFKFIMPTEVAGKQIIEAKIGFYVWGQSNFQEGQYMELYKVQSEWTENEVTWNNASAGSEWATSGGDISAEPIKTILHEEGVDHAFYSPIDMTDIVQGWINGETNYGLMLENNSETNIGLKASEYSNGKRTYLEITYID